MYFGLWTSSLLLPLRIALLRGSGFVRWTLLYHNIFAYTVWYRGRVRIPMRQQLGLPILLSYARFRKTTSSVE